MPPLVRCEYLDSIAHKNVEMNLRSGGLNHTNLGPYCRGPWLGLGENIAKGQSSINEVMRDWLNSPGHRSNILNSRYTHIGYCYKGGLWAVVFGRKNERILDIRREGGRKRIFRLRGRL